METSSELLIEFNEIEPSLISNVLVKHMCLYNRDTVYYCWILNHLWLVQCVHKLTKEGTYLLCLFIIQEYYDYSSFLQKTIYEIIHIKCVISQQNNTQYFSHFAQGVSGGI